jgi:putative ABC transport system permease protein
LFNIAKADNQVVEIPSVDYYGNDRTFDQPRRVRIKGIVKNLNFQTLHMPLAPMVLGASNSRIHNIDYFTARLNNTNNAPETLAQMEKIIHAIDPTHLFEYHFLDQQWDLFYREDHKRQTIFIAIAVLTIFIACLGLFGLATYAAQQRIKEIGIRKVLGAGVTGIVVMLSKDFLKLVCIAALIAIPVSWWAMDKWLNDFAYRIPASWWVFALSGVVALVIALATVSFQAMKAAMRNPVKSLRTE